MKKLIFVIITINAFIGMARADFTVKALTGDVFVETQQVKQKLKMKVSIPDGSMIFSDQDGSQILLFEADLQERFLFKAPFKVKLSKSVAVLSLGKIRAQIKKGRGAVSTPEKFHIITPGAVIGVRGTDFYVSYQPLLSETEVICFESSVDFKASDNLSSAVVDAGQWGGIGGRFGGKIAPPLNLPNEFLSQVKKDMLIESIQARF